MVHPIRKHLCCGCGACANICPKGCITMVSDEEGFLYPQVDTTACIQCDLCEKVCPMSASTQSAPLPTRAYGVKNRNEAIRKRSSSGGVFTALAEHTLSQGGVVFGAAMTRDLQVYHMAVEEPEQLWQLQGSKYVQSQIGDTYAQAKAYLKAGRPVLFSGTPCQISGLKAFLGKDYDHLLCQDIICHGAPSPAVWKQYVAYRESVADSKAKNVSFRYKDPSWTDYQMRFEFENGSIYQAGKQQDPYMRAFLADLCLRPSCYSCAFKGQNRPADITLADYWGVWDIHPEVDDDKGTSLVFTHSEKGAAALEAIREQLEIFPTQAQEAIRRNSAMIACAPRPKNREAFLSQVQADNFEQVVNQFRPKPSLLKRLLTKAKGLVKKLIR